MVAQLSFRKPWYSGGPRASIMCPTPVWCGLRPVSRDAREGQQRAELYICEKRSPDAASLSRLGVRISEP